MLDRRSFLSRTAALGMGLTLPPTWITQAASAAPPATVSRRAHHAPGLLAFLALDDLRYLTGLLPDTSSHVHSVFARYFDRLRAAHHIEAAPTEIIAQLVDNRANWPNEPLPYVKAHWWVDEMREPKLAAAAGVLVHHAMHPHLPPADTPEAQRQQDATALRALHGFNAPVDVDALANLVEQAYTRTAIRMHTFEPDHDAIDDWILDFVDWHASIPDQARAFAEAYAAAQPMPALINPEDALVQIADQLRHGQPVLADTFKAAMDRRADQSAYAQALAAGFEALHMVGRFMADGCTADDLNRHFG